MCDCQLFETPYATGLSGADHPINFTTDVAIIEAFCTALERLLGVVISRGDSFPEIIELYKKSEAFQDLEQAYVSNSAVKQWVDSNKSKVPYLYQYLQMVTAPAATNNDSGGLINNILPTNLLPVISTKTKIIGGVVGLGVVGFLIYKIVT